MQSYELLYLGQLLNALLGSFYLFIYLFFLFFEALVILDPCLSVYTEFAFTVKRIYRFLGLARIQKSHFNYTHCSTYICVYTEKRTNDPWKKEHPSKKIFERCRMHGFRNTTFSYFFSIYRAEGDIEKRWKDIKMTNKLTDFSIWSLYISFLEISKHDEFILLHRREWEREREI